MHVTFGAAGAAGQPHVSSTIGARTFSVHGGDGALVVREGTRTVVLDGDLHYAIAADGGTSTIPTGGAELAIAELLRTDSPATLPSRLEGSYVGAWVDERTGEGGAFADQLNRRALYLVDRDGEFLATTTLEAAVDAAGARGRYNQNALYSYFVLGYPGARETFYEGVTRLAPDEQVHVTEAGAERTMHRVVRRIEPFGRDMLDEYDRRISTAVSSRASDGGNVVMNSGGWDSTSLIYLLRKDRGPEQVRAVVFDVMLPDGQSFNVYEVDKAKRIASFFGIETDRSVIDYADRNLVDYWERALPELRAAHVYFWLHHLRMADTIAEGAPAAAAFNGEASDSIHNFGFSQFVSVNYDNLLLREYADKAKSYLYGPTFFSRVLEGTSADDRVLAFFQKYYGSERFEPTDGDVRVRRRRYFESFMLSYPRVPFARWHPAGIASDALRSQFDAALLAGPLEGPVDEATPDTLYYWLLQLYREFHFQSYQIAINHVATARHGQRCHMPFLDAQLVDYMYRMPESWGRGLELRTTKYPLRYLANERWRMPVDILEEGGPHSYIAENDRRWTYAGGTWSIYCEIMFKSVFADYFRELFSRRRLDEVLDPSLFDVSALERVVKAYVDGVENPGDVGLLFKLGVLFSVGLYA